MRYLVFVFLLFAFPAHAQNTLFPANPGDMIVKGTVGAWTGVPGGVAGCVLTSRGPTAAPTWQCALALNFQLPPMATNKIWGNVSGTQAPAAQIDVSQFLNTLDYDITRPPVAGATIYKGTDNQWHSAPPAQAGYVWTTQGNGQIPQWTLSGGVTPTAQPYLWAASYGVVCDGTGDQAPAINAVIAVAALTARKVVLPATLQGCAVSSTIHQVQGVTLAGTATITDQLGFSQPSPIGTKIKWTGGNIAATIIDTPADLNTDWGFENLTIDGRVAFADLPTSALKGLKVGTSFNSKINNINIVNVGTGISLEPGFGVATLPIISWANWTGITMTYVGTGMDFSANATIGLVAGGVTNNFFNSIVIFEPTNYGINFRALSDDNHFNGVYIDTSTVGAVPVIFNSLDPTNPDGVYTNSMVNLEINCGAVGATPIIANNSNGFGTYIQGAFFLCGSPTIQNGANITIMNDIDPLVIKSQKDFNTLMGLSLRNTSALSAAYTGFILGNDTAAGIGNFVLNSSTNTAFGGANSVNIYNTTTAPVAISVNAVTRHKVTNTGNVLVGTLTLSNTIGDDAGTTQACYSTATGALTYHAAGCTVSDAALKKDVRPIVGALALLDKFEGKYYRWVDPMRGEGQQIGIIANDAEPALPELVSKGASGLRSFDYQHFTAVLLSAVKELKADNDNLRVCQQRWTCRLFGR